MIYFLADPAPYLVQDIFMIMQLFKKVMFVVIFFLILLPFLNKLVERNHLVEAKEFEETLEEINSKRLGPQAQVLADYLAQYNSPLAPHAQDFIDAAREYNLDWRLVVSIAGVESTFGKFTPGGYNGWGWGVYDTQAIYFKSWKEGIYAVSLGLRENYINKGLTNPYLMNRLYAQSPSWGGRVTYFMNEIDKFAQNYEGSLVDINASPLQTAASSGKLNQI